MNSIFLRLMALIFVISFTGGCATSENLNNNIRTIGYGAMGMGMGYTVCGAKCAKGGAIAGLGLGMVADNAALEAKASSAAVVDANNRVQKAYATAYERAMASNSTTRNVVEERITEKEAVRQYGYCSYGKNPSQARGGEKVLALKKATLIMQVSRSTRKWIGPCVAKEGLRVIVPKDAERITGEEQGARIAQCSNKFRVIKWPTTTRNVVVSHQSLPPPPPNFGQVVKTCPNGSVCAQDMQTVRWGIAGASFVAGMRALRGGGGATAHAEASASAGGGGAGSTVSTGAGSPSGGAASGVVFGGPVGGAMGP